MTTEDRCYECTGSGELNDETGMEWVSNAGMLRADEIHGSVLETVPIFGEEDPEPKSRREVRR